MAPRSSHGQGCLLIELYDPKTWRRERDLKVRAHWNAAAAKGRQISRRWVGRKREATFTVISLPCSQCADLSMEEEGGGGSAVFSRTSFLCVGLIGAERGKEPTIQLAVSAKHPALQNTQTHTLWQQPCTQFPAWESERRKKKKGSFWRWKAPDNHSLLGSRAGDHEMRHEVVWGEKRTVRKLDWGRLLVGD